MASFLDTLRPDASLALYRYGAHGTSYRYLVGEAARMLGQPAESLNLIIAHVGPPCCSLLD